jgi:hypothetical protein
VRIIARTCACAGRCWTRQAQTSSFGFQQLSQRAFLLNIGGMWLQCTLALLCTLLPNVVSAKMHVVDALPVVHADLLDSATSSLQVGAICDPMPTVVVAVHCPLLTVKPEVPSHAELPNEPKDEEIDRSPVIDESPGDLHLVGTPELSPRLMPRRFTCRSRAKWAKPVRVQNRALPEDHLITYAVVRMYNVAEDAFPGVKKMHRTLKSLKWRAYPLMELCMPGDGEFWEPHYVVGYNRVEKEIVMLMGVEMDLGEGGLNMRKVEHFLRCFYKGEFLTKWRFDRCDFYHLPSLDEPLFHEEAAEQIVSEFKWVQHCPARNTWKHPMWECLVQGE